MSMIWVSETSLRRGRAPMRSRRPVACALVTAIVGLLVVGPAAVWASSPGAAPGQEWSRPAAPGLVRLHVVAHSDAPEDQRLKLLVRDALLARYGEELGALSGEPSVRAWAAARREAVERLARDVLAAEGATYGARLVAGWSQFPETRLGTRPVPAGRYLAVRLILGAGEGQNWWCVLFPPLCLIDESQLVDLEARPADAAVPAWIPVEGEFSTPVGVEWRTYLLEGPLGQEGSWPLRWAEVQQLMAGAASLVSPPVYAHEAGEAHPEDEGGPVPAP